MISVHFRGKPFNITIIQVYAPTTNAEAELFYEDLHRPPGTNTKKMSFIIGDWNPKVGSQEISGVTHKFGPGVQKEAGQRLTVLPRECTNHSKHPLPTTQQTALHKDITWWSTPKSDWLYSLQLKMEKLYTVSKARWGADLAQTMNSFLPNSDLNWRK